MVFDPSVLYLPSHALLLSTTPPNFWIALNFADYFSAAILILEINNYLTPFASFE